MVSTVAVSLDVWTLIAAAVCGAMSMRIVTWRPDGEQYRLKASLCAWLISAAAGCYSLSVVLSVIAGRPVQMVSPFLLIILCIVAGQVFRARGNVARVLRLDWGWSGDERRRVPRTID